MHWTRQDYIFFHLEGHGREALFEDVDLSRTVGWFTSIYPVLLDMHLQDKNGQPGMLLKMVKEQIRNIPHNGIGYGLLRYLCVDPAISEQMRTAPQPEISFNYLGQLDQAFAEGTLFAPALEASGPALSTQNKRAHLFDVTGALLKIS